MEEWGYYISTLSWGGHISMYPYKKKDFLQVKHTHTELIIYSIPIPLSPSSFVFSLPTYRLKEYIYFSVICWSTSTTRTDQTTDHQTTNTKNPSNVCLCIRHMNNHLLVYF